MKTLKEKIKVMQALEDGKTIQAHYLQDGLWFDCEVEPAWNWGELDYRIASKPPPPELKELWLNIYPPSWGEATITQHATFRKAEEEVAAGAYGKPLAGPLFIPLFGGD